MEVLTPQISTLFNAIKKNLLSLIFIMKKDSLSGGTIYRMGGK